MPSLYEARIILSLADLRTAAWLAVALQGAVLGVLLYVAFLIRRQQ